MKLRTWCIRIGQILTQTVLIFTGFLVFLTLFCLATIKAESDRGGITIRHQNVPIEKVFHSIEKQSGYRFFYNETLLQGAVKVTLNLQNASLQEALDACFHNQPLSYAIVDKTIIVKKRPEQQQSIAPIATAASISRPGKIIAVRGKVTSNNTPVAGATVTIKGTESGTSTDNDGVFSLPEVEENSTLVISSVSHIMREIKLNGQTYIAIDLAKQTDDLDEAVVVAYGTTTRRMNVGAVTVVKGEAITSLPNRSIDRSLQGMVPGLLVTSGNGQPGGSVSNFVLRGIGSATASTFGSNVRHPLIVVDGMPISTERIINRDVTSDPTPVANPLAQLNPYDIETISVLKDADAIALYGSRASNGVILITTKKGKAGKTTLNFQQQTDISTISRPLKVLSQDEYLELLFEAYRNSDPVRYADDAAILADLRSYTSTTTPKFPTIVNAPGDTSFYPTANWENALYNKNALTVLNDLSLSGGNEKNIYYLNFSYLKQNGIVKNTGFDRGSFRYNMENKTNKWLKLGVNSSLSYSDEDYSSVGDDVSSPLGLQNTMSPLNPIRQVNGDYIFNYQFGTPSGPTAFFANPVAGAQYNINRLTSYRGIGNVYANISFLKYFKFSTNIGMEFMLSKQKSKIDPRFALKFTQATIGIGSIFEQDNTRVGYNILNMLKFGKVFNNKHNVNAFIAQESRSSSQKMLSGYGEGLTYTYQDQLSQTSANYQSLGSFSEERMLSYFSQLNYSYDNKYLLSLNGRQDGNSKFGSSEPLRTYWSVGIGWVMSEEKFLMNGWMDFLKLRGSIGTSGNSTVISDATRYTSIRSSTYNGNFAVLPQNLGNPYIEPEKPFNTDLGIDAKLFNERVGFTVDAYRRKISQLIYGVTVPNNSGGESTVLTNIGDMENKGIEVLVSAKILNKQNFSWDINFTWSTNKNKLVKANPNFPVDGNYVGNLVNKVGENFESFSLVKWAGVDPADGKGQWFDTTGKITKTYSLSNRAIVGKPQPDGFGGVTQSFRYKQVELSFFLYYQYGFQIYSDALRELSNDGALPYVNQSKSALDRWQKPGDEALNPKRVLNNNDGSRNASTRYLFNGDFIRLQNISVGYNFPLSLIRKIQVSNLRVFMQGNNLKTWVTNSVLNPENTSSSGSNSFAYPQARSFSIGLNASF